MPEATRYTSLSSVQRHIAYTLLYDVEDSEPYVGLFSATK